MKDKASDKPGSTELDDKALDGVVGGCIPGGPSPITLKGTGGTGGTIKEPSAPFDPVTIRCPTK
jgi:hypothetical protein